MDRHNRFWLSKAAAVISRFVRPLPNDHHQVQNGITLAALARARNGDSEIRDAFPIVRFCLFEELPVPADELRPGYP